MKTVAKVFLWISIVGLALYVLMFGLVVIAAIAAHFSPSTESGPALLFAIVFGVMTVVFALMLAYNIYFLNHFGKAIYKSDIKTWQIVLLFFCANMVSGILLCCMNDNDFAPASAFLAKKPSPLDTIMKYKQLLDEGMITEEQYKEIKQKLLK